VRGKLQKLDLKNGPLTSLETLLLTRMAAGEPLVLKTLIQKPAERAGDDQQVGCGVI
jgi:hypothetical protein